MVSISPPGLVATSRPSYSRTVHGGLIQLSGLYALVSACTAIEPSAFSRISRGAAGRRAPRRPWYSTEQFATSMRTPRVVPHACTCTVVGVPCALLDRRRYEHVAGHDQRRPLQALPRVAHPLCDRRFWRSVPQRDLWPADEGPTAVGSRRRGDRYLRGQPHGVEDRRVLHLCRADLRVRHDRPVRLGVGVLADVDLALDRDLCD